MKISTLEVDKITDMAGNPIIDLSVPGKPVTVLDAQVSNIDSKLPLMTAGEFAALRDRTRKEYAGSGQSHTIRTFEEFIYDSPWGNQLFHTLGYPTNSPLKNSLALPLDARTYASRRYNAKFNIDGVIINYDEMGGLASGNHANDVSFGGSTSGIHFDDGVTPTVETNSATLSKSYAVGDMMLVTDVTRDSCPYGAFTTATTSAEVASYAISTITYDSVNRKYVLKRIAAGDSRAIFSNLTMLADVEYVLTFDITSSTSSPINPYIYIRGNTASAVIGIEAVTVDSSVGNTYTLRFTPRGTANYLLISGQYPNTGAVGDSYEIANVSIKPTKEYRLAVHTPITTSDLYTPANSQAVHAVDAFSRKDFVFIEGWIEDVASTGMVYPFGNVQYMGTRGDCAPGTFTGADTYSLFGDWQTPGVIVGKGIVWDNMSVAAKTAFAADVNNNMYIRGDVVYQHRYRTRVVKCIGNSLVGHNTLSYRGGGYAVRTYNSAHYIRAQGSSRTVIDLGIDNGSLLYTGTNTVAKIGAYGTSIAAVPLMQVQRYNTGIYDPVYNPEGTARVYTATGAKEWWELSTIQSIADCFNPANIAVVLPTDHTLVGTLADLNAGVATVAGYAPTGSGTSLLSGSPDGRYYDHISADTVDDLRMNANKIGDYDKFLKDQFRKATSNQLRGPEQINKFEQIGHGVKITGASVIDPHPTYGPYGWRLRIPATGSRTAASVDDSKFNNNSHSIADNSVLITGDNGKSLLITRVWHRLYPNGNIYLNMNDEDPAIGKANFDAVFPIGTTIRYHARVNKSTVNVGGYLECDIIGDASSYPLSWINDGVYGSPLHVGNVAGLNALESIRREAKGGYLVKLSRKLNSGTSDDWVRVLVTTNGVTTELPQVVSWPTLFTNGTSIGYYTHGPSNAIYFNLTGTGAHDPILEANTVIQVFYKPTANYMGPCGNTPIVTVGDGYVGNYYSPIRGGALRSMLTNKCSTSTSAGIPGDVDHRFAITERSDNHGALLGASWGIPPKHSTAINVRNKTSPTAKILPYLAQSGNTAYLNMLYKEVNHKSLISMSGVGNYGISVAISGTRMVVGANNATVGGITAAGTVHIYDWNGSKYVTNGVLNGTVLNEHFGGSVTLDGNRLVVGAVGGNTVYIYDWNGTAYVPFTTLTIPVGTVGSGYGISVALLGTRLVVGMYIATVGTTVGGGLAFVYNHNGTSYVLVQTISATTPQLNAYYGHGVSMSGTDLVVGSYTTTVNGVGGVGSVYYYTWNGTVYVYVSTLTPPDPHPNMHFGEDTEIRGNRLLIAAGSSSSMGSNADGKVYVYDWNGNNWMLTGTITSPNRITNWHFGRGLTFDGNRVAIGTHIGNTLWVGNLHTDATQDTGVLHGSWGDDNVFQVSGGEDSKLDNNGVRVNYGQRQVRLQHFIE